MRTYDKLINTIFPCQGAPGLCPPLGTATAAAIAAASAQASAQGIGNE